MNGLLRALAVIALIPIAGCARYEIVADGPPRTEEVPDKGLSAEVRDLPEGAVNLRVHREIHFKHQQDFVRHRAEAELPAVRVAGTAGLEPLPNGDPVQVSSGYELIVLIPILAAVGLALGIYYGTALLVDQVSGLIAVWFPAVHARSTQVREDFQWNPSPSVTLEPADGSAPLDLGPQPFAGYDLDAATVRRLAPPGIAVVVRDGERWTMVVLQPSR